MQGVGLVIYWFGFIEEMQGQDMDILIMDQFPLNITTLQLGTPITARGYC
jgi:hypothetical protein